MSNEFRKFSVGALYAQALPMRRLLVAFAALVAVAVVACGTSHSEDATPDGIHPQPQPNNGQISITAPCTPTTCGAAPSTFQYPKCVPDKGTCKWIDETTVSFEACDAAECGTVPGAEVCPSGTTFSGNNCGSENGASCAWTTACVPPRSTTPCPDPNGCGDAKPELGVICKDGSTGDLACFQLANGACAFQRTCD